mmetsp:Transcript_1066/g.3048  ORF Transcript_1066/g.3048 Transcript_1066/m.3048 type:complete len:262 (-) Transcript_1066:716-1501(-)
MTRPMAACTSSTFSVAARAAPPSPCASSSALSCRMDIEPTSPGSGSASVTFRVFAAPCLDASDSDRCAARTPTCRRLRGSSHVSSPVSRLRQCPGSCSPEPCTYIHSSSSPATSPCCARLAVPAVEASPPGPPRGVLDNATVTALLTSSCRSVIPAVRTPAAVSSSLSSRAPIACTSASDGGAAASWPPPDSDAPSSRARAASTRRAAAFSSRSVASCSRSWCCASWPHRAQKRRRSTFSSFPLSSRMVVTARGSATRGAQ